ncbi:calcium-dependent lipid-binding-like protein [Medicago truncatula]|uniref:Calcium-dependent lipid-binding-like protein n=1 Tax=Medicago truncatula TaxID=3880 RepID=A0A072V2R4_MEDTR|nr:calcium-dependent lipid-binding-like protein [Medicago truncatula]
MFEAHVLHLLRKYLGEYVHGLSAEALRISVWKGDVVLKDLKLKSEALNALKLPVTVKSGFVGTITLKVPWKSLGKEPVIVLIDRVFVLANPAPDSRTIKEEDREKLFQDKLQQIEEAESATLDAISKSKLGNPSSGNSWLSSLISTIIGNLKISISNVHIRYEDSVSNPGHPFSSGVTLAKLAAVTMDEQGNETFDTSGALDRLRKSVHLERLALYHDSDRLPWEIDKRWEDIGPHEWIEIFEDGINEPTDYHKSVSKWAVNRTYLVYPINAVLQYHRLGNQERSDPEIPFEKVSLVLSDVSLTLTEAQYHDWIKLLEAVSRYKTYMEVSHLRPSVPISRAPYLWWQYAAQATLQQLKMCYRLSWDQIRHLCQRRRRYIQLYVASLQQSSNVNYVEIREIEKDLDSKVILLWRLLAHAKAESVKSKVAAEERKLKNKSWFSFRWYTDAEDSLSDASEEQQLKEERLTTEEWQAINKLLSFQPEEELMLRSAKDAQNMVQFLVTVSIGQAAARIISVNQVELVCGRFEQLDVSTKFRHHSVYCDVLLKFYGLSAPEGSLTQSVYSEQKVNALVASFVHLPIGENIDWRLSATIAPCHVTVLMDSIDRVFEFLKRSKAVSPTVALETATALQMKFEKVTRRAQEQFQMVLEEKSRFAFDIDLDAPKVRVPLRTSGSDRCDSHFLLDFGHFTLHTAESQSDEQRQNLYSRFYITGRDIAAFFTDCGSDFGSCSLVKPNYDSQIMNSSTTQKEENVYSLLDRCGMAVLVNQIKVPHPSYPSTLISIQVPNLGIHLSSERYFRIMELLNILYQTMEICSQPASDSFQSKLTPWGPADLATDGRILVWKGIGNSVATWHPCFLVLSGSYLYVFESAKSQSYHRYLSMAGRQVLDVPPMNVGGSPFCIAVSTRGMDIQKALESSSTWILDFREEEEKGCWFKGLIQATYQASTPLSVDVLGNSEGATASYNVLNNTNSKTADIVINGALMEAKLFVYGKAGNTTDGNLDESLILEIVADGGKVHVILAESDLTVKMKLHSLKIKDELQGRLSVSPQYLAVSVLKNETLCSSSDSHGKDNSFGIPDDDDSFMDALSDFISQTDGGHSLHNMELDQQGLMGIASDFESLESLIHEKEIETGNSTPHEEYYEAEGSDTSNFVSMSFSTRSPGSPDYDGIDTQMCVRMSKLEFFCNRPTIVALISFGLDISSGNKVTSDADTLKTSPERPLVKERTDEKGRVRGLLGFGKERVVFHLNMNMDSVTIFLNKEDGSQLAKLVQESFLMDLKVHPSSLSIDGTLGNFRLCDTSLGSDQCWDWLCDIRNPGVESLIKFKFNSYSAEDDDYEGYDYSLEGQLSAVRIVFLYRFVQEITVYFMELASPHTEEAIKLVDKVGGFEWLIQKYEIDGATALKLDLALDTPIIVVPKNSMSKDFIQLDLGKLQIKNEFSWHGSREEDPSAVHIDVLHAQILGINMSVGIDGCLGKPMIREGQGLDIFVRRSLRDVFRKVPTFSLDVKVDLLHGVMSDKEYKVILDCTTMNLSEEPRLPASFRGGKSGSKDTIKLLVDKVNLNSQNLLSQTVTIITVVGNHALLELCNGTDGESPLAHIALEGLWVSYRMTSSSETDLFVTIPKFSILDFRPDTKPEMRLMLGSSTDAFKQAFTVKVPFLFNPGSFRRTTSEAGIDNMPISTMFLMDYRWRMSSQSFVIRVQQPRVLVVPDFLLAVAEFFVPALGALTGREETTDPKNDPISRNSSIVLMEAVYRQEEDVVHLSPSKQLVADWVGIDEYTYDGCGKVICLSVETDTKEVRSTRFRPIIVIGRGKRLRFVNVKIEVIRFPLIRKKYTYLSNDSSYSISIEDGVDIVVPGDLSSGDEKNLDTMNQTSGSSLNSQSESNETQSFTFETQVVSSDFTFYDGTKSFLDDSSYSEKLIRAKLDLSFMYASKEKDTWIRALAKDFTVEAGSGLVILDPVDISGGYTSVKDKTNISLLSTDICIHLSLSAISLILNLQSQASAALNLGNATPLVPCTNFDRVWVSEKETGPNNNITFWRPQAPANYVILGDCVTSRPIPPSQAVMAVSNTYGRVRKPVDFHLIGSFQNIRGGGNNGHSVGASDCSLWMPVAPPGYTTLGCVAHVGNQPPPNHVVYCLRSDLLTSAKYSDCIFNISSNDQFTSGFSVWRLDNAIGSFFAYSSSGFPLKDRLYDLNHLLVWNSNRAPLMGLVSDFNSDQENNNQQTTKSTTTSGWDILKSITKATNCYMSTPNFERIWWDKGSDLRRPVSIWRPTAHRGYAVLGDCITEGLEPPALGIIFKNDNPEISSKPLQFTKVSHIAGKGIEEVFFWYPIAPPGYVSLGCVVTRTDEAPRADLFCCPRMDLVSQANIHEAPLSRSAGSRAPQSWSIWKVENQACTFLARSDLKKPSSRLAYIIGDSVKPKTRENVNAELKLRYFSLTILDSLCGMMRPLFDTTITNIKLATHGGLHGMNAVLISSIVASTFNAQLEAWEPLVEPFDGIFKFETFDTNAQPPFGLGKRIRISATSILNVNVSAANLESFVGSVHSWRRQLEFEQKASKLNAEAGGQHSKGESTTFSALDEDDLQTVIVENKLGCDIFVKKVDHDVDTVDMLHHGNCVSVWIPPPRFSDRLNVADESRESRFYVAVQILEAKGLPINDDGNSHSFFCALRLVVDSQASEQQKLFPQSARTKCVKPVISRINNWDEGNVKWNELFIFEVPRKAPAKLEIEVTNLAAKAGKGDVVGALSFSVGHGANTLKKVASVRMVHQPYDVQNIRSYPLTRMAQQSNVEIMHDGCLSVSTSYFERNTIVNLQKELESENTSTRDIGFWVGLDPEGEWESIRSLLPLSVAPKSLQNEYIGMEVVMKNGKKHVILRGLVAVLNDSDVMLNISTCLASFGHDPSLGTHTSNTVVEEVFQNQYYQLSSGWGNNWPGVHPDNPGHWSTRDFSYSSKDFFEPPLPPGWKWASGWSIDKFQNVDKEGWAYGPDIKNLRWPPASSKSSTKSSSDVVRRRRWIRSRQTISQQSAESLHSGVSTVHPGASTFLSWRSTSKDSEQYLQIRPSFDNSQPSYSWGHAVAVGSSYIYSKDQQLDPGFRQNCVTSNCSLKLNEMEKKDILLCCNPSSGSKQLWFSVGTDASVLNTELNIPVYDWRISIFSPMKLENRLPCPVEFSISEKTKEGNCVERHRGVISSRQSVHIYSVDIQKPLYLTLSVQHGWVMEKDPILLLDPSFSNHVSYFWMVHRQSRRRLRVSIEHDMGGTSAAPKTLRLFVPYWIANDSSLPLAYRLVEVEPLENAETDSVLLSRAVKSAKTALKNPISSMDRRHFSSRRNLQVLETIEDNSPFPSMLSPQDYAGRSGVFQSQKDTYLSPRLGISVSMRYSEVYSPGISLLELENKERIDVKAFKSEGSYYKLSALLKMTSDRTKVVHFQPHTMFTNRIGCSLCLQQCDTQSVVWIHPTDPPKPFEWQSSAKVEFLKLRIDGYKWSTPFSVNYEGVMRISLKKEVGDERMQLRVAVRSGAKRSRFEVVFRLNSLSSPYRVENRSMFLPIRIRQADGIGDSWQLLLPNSAASFLWEDLGRRRLLELLVDGTDPMKSLKYDIDEISDHQPLQVADGPTRALRVTIVKEEKTNVVKISDWMPEIEPIRVLSRRHSLSVNDSQKQQLMSDTDFEFHINVDLAELGVSIIDHTPEEILYLSIQNLVLAYSTGLGSGISRFKLRMCGLQVDNQLPLTPTPVLFRPQRVVSETDYILKFSITMQSDGSLDLCVYPYIGLHGPESSAAFLINIHEPIIWRLHEMIQQVKLGRLSESQTTAASVDPIIEIGVLNISEVRFKVSMAMSPSQRPRGVLGFWASLMTALGNTENMPVRINQRFNENVCMRQSSMISMAISNIRKDLLGQPLQLLSGVDILGNASSALGHMSKGVAALSMDKKFIQSRQRQESKGVEDFGDVLREGGGAFAKGLFRGVTGILTKPLEGAKTSGVEGFVQGVGRGIIGVAAQPVSGVLDLLSKTTEGANAMRMKIASALTSDEQLLRRRLPRVISGDNLLQLYDEYKAQGQVILQLAESGSFFGQVDLFKVRGKFALSDAYEDHFMLPKGKILMVTHRRVILLQQPSNIIAQRKFSPAKDPCSIAWDIMWDDLAAMEQTHGKKDNPKSPPSRLILYLKSRSFDVKENVRIVKCNPESHQALQVYSSIDHALSIYGPGASKGMLKNKVTKPYSPLVDGPSVDVTPKEGVCPWSPQQMPGSVPLSSSFGSSSNH